MEWWVILIIFFGSLGIFFATGLPIAVSFLALDVIGLLWFYGIKGLLLLPNSIYDSIAAFTLTPIPLFILLGELLYQSKAVDICFSAMDKWVGSIRARLLVVTLIFGAIFGAISGAAIASCAIMGSIVLPEMLRRGYDKRLSLSVILGSSSMDPLIPPSVLAVVVASMANVSVAKLLISGIGPGLLLGVFYLIYIVILILMKPDIAPAYQYSTTFKEKIIALLRFLPFLLIIFLVLGLLLLGIATPTESAATGVIGAMVVSYFYGRLTPGIIKKCLVSTLKVSGTVLIIIASSKAYSQLIAISGGARGMVEAVSSLSWHPMWMLLIMQLVPFILGCFIEQYGIMMITIPIYIPLIELFKFDPIWFWCLYLINMTVGGFTPPFGLVLFTLNSVAKDTPLHEVYRAAVPIVMIIIINMLLLAFFPDIILWLPNHLVAK